MTILIHTLHKSVTIFVIYLKILNTLLGKKQRKSLDIKIHYIRKKKENKKESPKQILTVNH